MQILGLDICANTSVDIRRGISGGQKKRLTTGITAILQNNSLSNLYTFRELVDIWSDQASDSGVLYRRDDCWTNKSTLYGWNIQWFRQLHYFPDYLLSSASGAYHKCHCINFTPSASTRDLWSLWWYCFNGRRENCVPRTAWLYTWVLWGLWV